MRDWLVPLVGPEDTLSRMTEVFTGPELQVFREEKRYFMRSTRLAHYEQIDEVMNAAGPLILRAAELMNLYVGTVGRIDASGAIWRDATGYEHGVGSVMMGTLRVLSANGLQRIGANGPGKRMGNRLLTLALADPLVQKVLRSFGIFDPSWADLYVLLEMVVQDLRTDPAMHGEKAWSPIAAKGWATKSFLEDLKRSANENRHAKGPGQPPARRISLDEARAAVRGILWNWLESRLDPI